MDRPRGGPAPLLAYARFEHKVLPEARERVRVLREKQGVPSHATGPPLRTERPADKGLGME
ncbi:hypothetical protein PUN71_015610 [Arthrobacter sp. NQ7]|nr:hypothetical protein [Arthrobacter sp. NQ7]